MTKYLIIALVVLITILSIYMLTQLPKKTPSDNFQPSPSIKTELKISSVSPSDKTVNVATIAEIVVYFSRPLHGEEEEKVILSTEPSIEGFHRLSSDKTTYTLTPDSLRPNQLYKINVSSPAGSSSWVFTTASKTKLSEKEQISLQAEADKNFGDWQKSINEKYPWRDKLPIQASNYYVYFDMDQEKFIAKLYPQKNSSKSIDNQVSEFKVEISQKISSIDSAVMKYGIIYEIKPE